MSSFTAGQVVGILRTGSWDTITEGKYTINRVTKMKIEMRNEQGHIREFSAKTDRELGEFASKNTWIVTEARYDAQLAQKQAQRLREQAMVDIKKCAEGLSRYGIAPDQLTMMRALLDEAEKFALVA
jgi:DNA-binding protein H-NS